MNKLITVALVIYWHDLLRSSFADIYINVVEKVNGAEHAQNLFGIKFGLPGELDRGRYIGYQRLANGLQR